MHYIYLNPSSYGTF